MAVFLVILSTFCFGIYFYNLLEGKRANENLETLRAALLDNAPQQEVPSTAGVVFLKPDYHLPDIFAKSPSAVSGGGGRFVVDSKLILPQYRKAYKENNDLVGWLEIPGTMLNLPIMHTPEDGEFYLYRLFDKTDSVYGTPFLDARCTVSPRSDNLILHGHHMRDGTMFSTLSRYEEEAFFRSHPIIHFDTLYEEGTYEIVSVFLSVYDKAETGPDLYYNFIHTEEQEEFDRFVLDIKTRSLYDTGITPSYGDRLVTLITCSDNAENGRINVVARQG